MRPRAGPAPIGLAIAFLVAWPAPATGQHVLEARVADSEYRFVDWNHTWTNHVVVDAFYVGVPGSNEVNVGAGFALARGRLVLTPLAYGVVGKEGGQRGVKLAALIAFERGPFTFLSFLGRYVPIDGSTAPYLVLDALDVTRLLTRRWEAGGEATFFRTGGAWNAQAGPLLKLNDGHGAWAASYRFGSSNELRLGRVCLF